MNDREEHDDLWDLLGKAKTPQPSEFFSRNVLREIRALQESKPEAKSGLVGWLRAQWRVATLGVVAALLLGVNAVQFFTPHHSMSAPVLADNQSPPAPTRKDYEVIKHLDELVAYEEHSIWLDDSTQ